jgi:hypothetical protein
LPGERDLDRLLATLNPKLYPDRYAFAAATDPVLPPDAFGLVREEEGLTAIRPDPSGEWARITLGVVSSLEAVGLTAVLSARLAEAGISANVVAGLNHDHFFVPWERRDEAVGILGHP